MFVHHDHQFRGLGIELGQHAADRSSDALTLSVSRGNRRAIHGYRNVGSEPVEDEDLALIGGEVDVDRRLPLSHPIADLVRLPPAER